MAPGVIRFGEYALDGARYELRKGKSVLKLEKIPMELLILLAGSGGRLVTREEIEEKIWGKGVFVDAEHGINTAVRKVRQTLGDDPDKPRFVQTVQKRGYRFVAEVRVAAECGSIADGQTVATTATEAAPLDATGSAATAVAREAENGTVKSRNVVNRKWAGVAVAAVIVAAWPVWRVVGSRMARTEREPTIRSIAVLPLENISGDKEQEFFADGMTDELITMLAKYPSLRVISRTSVMEYKGVHRPLPEIAKELGVDGVIEGSVSRGNGRVLVRAQLIYAPKEKHLWAESYNRDAGDVLSLQEELAQNIAERVSRAASPAGATRGIARGTSNQAARDAYYRGKLFWSAGHYDKSEEYFGEAIRLDPDYGDAYAGIADSYTAEAVSGEVRPRDVMEKAQRAVRKALELDEGAAAVHHSNAAVKLFFEWDWESAERESERALKLNPGIAEAHHLHSYVLEAANRTEEALQEDKLCVELDPFGRSWAYGFALYRNRRFDEAIAEFKQRADVLPNGGLEHGLLASSYAHKGDAEMAVKEWKEQYVKDGEPEIATKIQEVFQSRGIAAVRELQYRLAMESAKTRYVSQMELAERAAQANHKAEALQHLENAYQERQPLMVRLLHDPELDPLSEEPRFKALVRKMGLPGGK